MSNSYVLLEKIVVPAAGASSVTFANIPQTGYTDLVVVSSARSATGSGNWDGVYVSFNGTSVTTNHSARRLYGFSSTAASDSSLPYAGIIPSNGTTANTFGSASMYIPNYAGNTNKSISVDASTENNSVNAINFLTAGLWSNTAAITSITLTTESTSNFMANSTFYLYGIAKFGTTPTIAPKATGGDVIDTDGTYWYHIFNSSGTFTPATALTCDYLVVAGGGGGGGGRASQGLGGGGGGAGGYRTSAGTSGGNSSAESSLQLLTNTNYTVTIGAGGNGGGIDTSGSQGSNSVFSTITSVGGGFGAKGGSTNAVNGGDGGSGGGAGFGVNGQSGGNPTTNQGLKGGDSDNSGVQGCGGGGGAGVAGGNGRSTPNYSGGNGGNGLASTITGSSVTRAGGGGAGGATALSGLAGSAGTGGGGAGSATGTGDAGSANTGGGGGGGARNTTAGAGGNGGSGIVVVRYLVA
jgi:hypothetical protein